MRLLLFVCVLLIVSIHGNAQRPSFGRCPSLGGGKTLDIDRMKGRWYEVERSFYLFELNQRCISMDFTPEGNGIRITTKAVSRTSSSPVTDVAVARPTRVGGATMKLTVDSHFARRLPTALRRALPGSGEYVVLSTDYDNYAVVYSCSDIVSILHADLIWVLARTQDLPVAKRLEIYGVLERAGLGSDRLTLTSHRDCPSSGR